MKTFVQSASPDIITFFDDFVAAFARFDGALIAARYASPYLAMHADGTADWFTSQEKTGRYFQRVLDAYYARGCRASRYDDLTVVPLGERCVLATLSWDLLTEKGAVMSVWRESYNLVRVVDASTTGLKVYASVDHAQ